MRPPTALEVWIRHHNEHAIGSILIRNQQAIDRNTGSATATSKRSAERRDEVQWRRKTTMEGACTASARAERVRVKRTRAIRRRTRDAARRPSKRMASRRRRARRRSAIRPVSRSRWPPEYRAPRDHYRLVSPPHPPSSEVWIARPPPHVSEQQYHDRRHESRPNERERDRGRGPG